MYCTITIFQEEKWKKNHKKYYFFISLQFFFTSIKLLCSALVFLIHLYAFVIKYINLNILKFYYKQDFKVLKNIFFDLENK